jgi:hypothetical protein
MPHQCVCSHKQVCALRTDEISIFAGLGNQGSIAQPSLWPD